MQKDFDQARNMFLQHMEETKGRATEERLRLLEFLYEYKEPFTTTQLYQDFLAAGNMISRATVYNSMQLFLEANIVMQIQLGSVGYRYIPAISVQGVQYLICTRCGRTARIANRDVFHDIYRRRYTNFNLSHFAVILYGHCRKCSPSALKAKKG